MNQLSVVIPTYNSAKSLNDCLNAIQKLASQYLFGVEIVIVDGGSADDTVGIAKMFTDNIIVSSGISRGAARNIGAKAASNDLLAFLDSDCILTTDWVEHMLKIDYDLGSSIIGGPVVLVSSNTLVGTVTRDLLSNPIFTLSSLTFSLLTDKRKVSGVPSSNMIISKQFFERIGGFPDLNFNEDTLFCKRVVANGGKISYNPDFRVIHKRTFDSVNCFSHYFFKYGQNYARSVKQYPELFGRYAILALLLPLFFIGSLILFWIDVGYIKLFLAMLLLSFIGIMFYSLARFKKKHAAFVPLFFTVLVLSYLSGFYFGILKD